MLYKWEFIDEAIRRDYVGPDYGGVGVYTAKVGPSRWETRVYDDGADILNSAVTHCAALVDEQHDDMVAAFSGLYVGPWDDDDI